MDWICPKCGGRFSEHPGVCPLDGSNVAPDLIGKDLQGRYRIHRLIGVGGMGCVYEAVQLAINRKVAIKFLPFSSPATVARFRREALTVSHLEHHNTITVFDFGETEDGMLFLVMELLEGRTLGEVLAQEGALEPARALHIIDQVFASLGEAHARGIVHRDLKPENIFLVHRGDDPDFVKVLDFGLAKVFHSDTGEEAQNITQDGSVFGTPHYMSPEQAAAQPLDQRSDIYSAGVVLHHMLTGKHLFSAKSLALIMAMQAETPPPTISEVRPDLAFPPGLEELVLRFLAKDPAKRPGSASEARALIAEVASRGPGVKGKARGSARGGGAVVVAGVVLGGLLLMAGAGLGTWLWLRPKEVVPVAETVDHDAGRPEPPAPRRVTIRVQSDPDGATVQRGDELLGKTPVKLEVEEDEGVFELLLTRKGYKDLRLQVDPDDAQGGRLTVTAKMEKRPATKVFRRKPRRRASSVSAKPSETKERRKRRRRKKPRIQVLDD